MSGKQDTHPQTIPLIYDALVKLGYDTAAQGLVKDSKQNKDELVKGVNSNFSVLDWIKTLPTDKVSGKKT